MSPDNDADLLQFLASLGPKPGAEDRLAALHWLRDHLHERAHRLLPANDAIRRRLDSEDVSQDALWQLISAAPNFRGTTWREFLGFADEIVRREIHRQARFNRAMRRDLDRVEPRATEPQKTDGRTPSFIAAAGEDGERVNRLIAALAIELRDVLALRLEGRSYEDIAVALSITAESARQRMSRAVATLRRGLADRDSTTR